MPFRDDLLNPIPGDNPGGINLRYDPVADKIKEARREDFEAPQGAWKSTLKVADYAQVVKLAGEAIATKGKDLQISVWMVDAQVRRDGFSALPPGFRFLQNLLDQFWDTLYPEIEDGDLEIRAAPLEWLGTRLSEPIRALPITSSKLTWLGYKDSRIVGYERDAGSSEKQALRNQLIGEGKVTAEEFDQAVDDTPKSFYESLATTLDDSLTSLASLIDFCDAKFSDASPSFITTRKTIEEITQLVRGFINRKGGPEPLAAPAEPSEEPEEPEQPVQVSAPVAAAIPVASPSGAAAAPARETRGSAGIEPTGLEDAATRLAAIARYLRKQDVYNIAPYMILRGFRWGEIRYNGPQIDVRMLEAPSAELRKQMKQAALESQWDKVLEATEAAMELPCGRGWLDLHRYTVKALEKKGEYFAFVADAVRTGVRGLLQDLPTLAQMTLLDDTPVANQETLDWIRQDVLPASVSEGAAAVEETIPQQRPAPRPAPVVEVAERHPSIEEKPPSMEEEEAGSAQTSDVFESALEGVAGGRLGDAVALLSAELERARSGRGRFKRRMQLAHVFMAGGHDKIAYPILEALAEEIDRRGLEDWESGDVLAHPLALLLKCSHSMNGNEEQVKTIYARICRLDPRKALLCLE